MTAATDTGIQVTQPGVYAMPFDDYLADPVPAGSLSSSAAKTLLNASPALFAYEREHGRPDKRVFDFGHAAHHAVLGAGVEVVPVDVDDWRTKAAREQRDEIRAAGAVPILRAEHEQVQAMAAALRAHPTAARLLDPERGTPEQSLFWVDDPSGVWRRARLDMLPHSVGGRMLVVDYKSTPCADPRVFGKSIASFGYHMQGAWYCDAVTELGLAEDAAFLLIAQEKTPPYLISVTQLSAMALRVGRERNRRAIDLYKQCTDTGQWPGYSPDVEVIDLPLWAETAHEREMMS